MFNNTREEGFVNRNSIFDKVIIDCAFREDLRRKKVPDLAGGCDGFQPSLTTGGFCYTFNGKESSSLWKSSEMINTFSNVFPSNLTGNKKFGGSRTAQGKYNLNKKHTE